jgi:Leucine-rich repeat (LRR) protein
MNLRLAILVALCLQLLLLLVVVRPIQCVGQNSSSSSSSCLFDGCQCSLNNDNSYDIKCIYDLKSNKTGFPQRLGNSLIANGSIANINIFLINKYSFKVIPDAAFANLTIRNLILAENNLEVLTQSVFKGVNGLRMLRLIEKKLRKIETGAFEPLRNKLSEFGVIELYLESKEMENFIEGIFTLEKLATFKLSNMQLQIFRPEWTPVLRNISYLSLASNRIKSLNANLFEFSLNLISLDLNNNYLSNLKALYDVLVPVRSQLKELKLSGNNFKTILEFPPLSNLELLDLSNNSISFLPKTTFKNLLKLNYLTLAQNQIYKLNDFLFSRLSQLLILQLNNNYLDRFPNISNLTRLQILDVSNQNGHLKEISDYEFERVDRAGAGAAYSNSLSLLLDANDFVRYGNKSFCSRHATNSSQIHSLSLSYKAMKSLDKCLLKQLRTTFVSRVSLKVQQDDGVLDYSDVCSCDFKSFALTFNIDLIGVCATFNEACSYYSNTKRLLNDDCQNKFDCDSPPSS